MDVDVVFLFPSTTNSYLLENYYQPLNTKDKHFTFSRVYKEGTCNKGMKVLDVLLIGVWLPLVVGVCSVYPCNNDATECHDIGTPPYDHDCECSDGYVGFKSCMEG